MWGTKMVLYITFGDRFGSWENLSGSQLAKMKKVHSSHVPAMKFIEKNGYPRSKKFQLKNYDFCEYEIPGNFIKVWYFVNNCLIKVRI